MKPGGKCNKEFGARLRGHLITTALLLAAFICGPDECAADEKLPFRYSGNAFSKAVYEYMHQAHWLTLYNEPHPLRDLQTKPIRGTYTAAQALAPMLKGTPIVFEFHDDGHFSV